MTQNRHLSPKTAPALTLRKASFGYGGRAVLGDVDGTIAPGELLALVGPNGAGKSTLLRGIVGEAALLAGQVDLAGLRSPDIAYLPQGPEVERSFPITVAEFASLGLWPRLGAWGRIGRPERLEVAEALERVGLAGQASRGIGALSGGQMQRLLFARTLLQDAPLILLDEPFTAIDHTTTTELMVLVQDWHRAGRTVLAALHDLGQVRAEFPRTLLLEGRPVAWGATEDVLGAEVTAPFCHHVGRDEARPREVDLRRPALEPSRP